MLTKRWNLTHDIPLVTILVDNKGVITRMQNGLPGLGIKKHLVPEYDLWAEVIHLTRTLPYPIKWKWVKAHQDSIKIDNLLVYGPLSATATVNVYCDKLATSAYRLPHPTSTQPHHMISSKISITINDEYIHTNLTPLISQAYHLPKIREHIMERTGWSSTTFDTVDWETLEHYIQTLKDSQRTNVVKFIHDWQNTGKQNQQFKDAEADKPDAYKTYCDIYTKCPYNFGDTETPLHYLHCTSSSAKDATNTLITNIKTFLKKEHTAVPIYNAIINNVTVTLQHHIYQ